MGDFFARMRVLRSECARIEVHTYLDAFAIGHAKFMPDEVNPVDFRRLCLCQLQRHTGSGD
ncbi:hypothetical protein AWV79_37160 [Cupriavidus sp. UYMMa02A]|nr:hypothetical protein AWV79_37160 [Cupriavidus sp. UYMMa02A]